MRTAIDVILAEHRALAAVLSALSEFTRGMVAGKYTADFELLNSMIAYVTELPEVVHHPKEDNYLFAALRKRSAKAAVILDQLQQEHRDGPARTVELKTALQKFRVEGPKALPAFQAALKEYLEGQWHHMSTEEKEVLPMAREALTTEDWAEIDAAFAANDNPWEGPAGVYKQLFTRIVTIAPAPIGVGDGGTQGRWHSPSQ